MALRPWLVAPGRRLNSPHSCLPIWSGGAPTIISCVPTEHCEWRLCSHECEVASWWRNGTSNERQRWPPAEPIDDGRLARCSLARCRQFPLESYRSQMRMQGHVAGRLMHVSSEEVGWASRQSEMACLDSTLTKILAQRVFAEAARIIHHIPYEYLALMTCRLTSSKRSASACDASGRRSW